MYPPHGTQIGSLGVRFWCPWWHPGGLHHDAILLLLQIALNVPPHGTQIGSLGVRFGALGGTTEGCIMMQPPCFCKSALNVPPWTSINKEKTDN